MNLFHFMFYVLSLVVSRQVMLCHVNVMHVTIFHVTSLKAISCHVIHVRANSRHVSSRHLSFKSCQVRHKYYFCDSYVCVCFVLASGICERLCIREIKSSNTRSQDFFKLRADQADCLFNTTWGAQLQ